MNHSNLCWCTPSVTPLQKRLMSALRRDLVVFDCQPPSNIWRKSSPTVAMWLPCRYTRDSPLSSQYVTLVLAFDQDLLLATASFICCSILRMVGVVWLTSIEYTRLGAAQPPVCHYLNCHPWAAGQLMYLHHRDLRSLQ